MTRRPIDPTVDLGQAANADRRRFLKTSAILASGLAVRSIVPGEAAAPPALPASCDLRAKNGNSYITSLKNQGTCHSCTAFGVVATIEGSYICKSRNRLAGPT